MYPLPTKEVCDVTKDRNTGSTRFNTTIENTKGMRWRSTIANTSAKNIVRNAVMRDTSNTEKKDERSAGKNASWKGKRTE